MDNRPSLVCSSKSLRFYIYVCIILFIVIFTRFSVAPSVSNNTSTKSNDNYDSTHDKSGNSKTKSKLRIVIASHDMIFDDFSALTAHDYFVMNRGPFLNITNEDYRSEDVGREGYLYLRYIYKYYYNLADITLFVQGRDILKPMSMIKGLTEGTITMTDRNDGFLWAHQYSCVYDYTHGSGDNHLTAAKMFSRGANMKRLQRILDYPFQATPIEKAFNIYNLINITYSLDISYPIYFIPNAIFAISRELIHRQPREYYAKVARLLGDNNRPFLG